MTIRPNTELDILVLMGGESDERDISLKSGAAALHALHAAGFKARSLTFEGTAESVDELISLLRSSPPDCVFNALHGGSGEDGHIPALLDLLAIPYTHSGHRASALAMDKPLTCAIARACGCQTAQAEITTWTALEANGLKGLTITPPCVIKPTSAGSTYGCVFVDRGDNDLAKQRPIDRPNTERVMVEAYVPGVELTVAVLNGKALACTEISFEGPIYDYQAKYVSGSVHHLPPRVPREVSTLAMKQAEAVHKALGCTGLTRCDFRYDRLQSDSAALVFIELNSHPGLTDVSLAPEQAIHVGIPFAKLCEALVIEALSYEK